MSELRLRVVREDDGTITLRAPTVGLVRGLPDVGALVGAGLRFELVSLGVVHTLRVPDTASGVVVARAEGRASELPVSYGDVLLRLAEATAGASAAASTERTGAAEWVFRAPMSGRFYGRPSPDKPLLVDVGSVVDTGSPLCLLEIMKTFHRVAYGGESLPPRARVVRVRKVDGDDVARGDVLFELEPA